jgi:hypothetical protein
MNSSSRASLTSEGGKWIAAMPVVGYLSARSSGKSDVAMQAAFRRGLTEIG